MNWDQLLSTYRLGKPSSGDVRSPEARTQFQRDYDRLIFSSPFRRLQNKTQVFPLPGSIFVHNRLTHSLEVASVGRSMGNMLTTELIKKGIENPLLYEIGSAVAAACLAHDLGNPPFGHSGEDAIKEFFVNGEGAKIKTQISDAEWADLINFDGNANAFRLLTHQFNGRRPGGFDLTITMLASIVKYPYESVFATKPKFGFFQSEKLLYQQIAQKLGLKAIGTQGIQFARHPLVYLVEAADDICYQIMDLEDAHKLKILSYTETMQLFLNFYDESEDADKIATIEQTLRLVTDQNEQMAYLRAGVMGRLINDCMRVFMAHYNEIMEGEFQGSLIKHIDIKLNSAMSKVMKVSSKRIYSDQSVVQIELAGYKIITTLLSVLVDAVLDNHNPYSKKLLTLIPDQFICESSSSYDKIQSVVDYVSGMTDVYALDLYRKITGINLPGIG